MRSIHSMDIGTLVGNISVTPRSISAESLLSTGDSTEHDIDFDPSRLHRPLSMLGMPGSRESAELVSPGYQNQAADQWNSDNQMLHSSSSKEVLRTISEDINKIRERKARKSISSSDTSLENSFHRVSSTSNLVEQESKSNQGSEFHRQSEVDIEDTSVDLPSHSICVDSGMAMEEDVYCSQESLVSSILPGLEQPEKDMFYKVDIKQSRTTDNWQNTSADATLHELSRNGLPTSSSTLESKNVAAGSKLEVKEENVNAYSLIVQENEDKEETFSGTVDQQVLQPQKRSTNSSPDLIENNNVFDELATDNPSRLDSHTNIANHNGQRQQPEPNNDNIFVQAKLVSIGRQSSEDYPVIPAVIKPTSAAVGDSKELANEPLEPLLSSQSVSLRTKLQRLSTLYDCDDGADLKHKPEQPSAAYDVFQAPKRIFHKKSRCVIVFAMWGFYLPL